MFDGKIRVVPHDAEWRRDFEREAAAISSVLGENVVAFHHIGSTAIADILAKPIIDLMVEVWNLAPVDKRSAARVVMGYEAMGEFGIARRRYFRKTGASGARTHHVHIFEMRSRHIERHLAFRDYLRANPDVARSYSDLKSHLTGDGGRSGANYVAGKAAFMKRTEDRALQWYRRKR